MDADRTLSVSSMIVSLMSIIIGIWSMEGVMVVVSLFAFIYSAISVRCCSGNACTLSFLTSVTAIACTSAIAFYEPAGDRGIIFGVLQTIPLLPLIIMTFISIAAAFKASYNWALVAGLSTFIGLGIQSVGYVLIYAIQWTGLGAEEIINGDALFSLGIALIATLLFSALLCRIFIKNGLIISSEGIVHRNAAAAVTDESKTCVPADASEDRKERRIAWTMLIACPLSMMAVFAIVTAGLAPGLDAGHPVEYLQATCVLWALVSTVIPILRILRIIGLPAWFMALVYFDMYLYVLSLCSGMYLSMSWWGDLSHIISGLIVASFVFIALCIMQYHSPSHITFGSVFGALAMLFIVAMSFGGIWEIMEGFTDAVGGKAYMIYGARDTVADMTADMTGVLAMSVIAYLILSRQSMEKVASTIKFGKKAFAGSEIRSRVQP